MSSEDPCPVSESAVFTWGPPMVEGAKDFSRVLQSHFQGLHPHNLIPSQRPPLHVGGLGFQHMSLSWQKLALPCGTVDMDQGEEQVKGRQISLTSQKFKFHYFTFTRTSTATVMAFSINLLRISFGS